MTRAGERVLVAVLALVALAAFLILVFVPIGGVR